MRRSISSLVARSKKRRSPGTRTDVNIRKALASSASASMGRNAVATIGSDADVASRRSYSPTGDIPNRANSRAIFVSSAMLPRRIAPWRSLPTREAESIASGEWTAFTCAHVSSRVR